MLQDLAASLSRPGTYRLFSAEKGARTAGYIAFLSLVFAASLGITLKLRLAPLFHETFAWLSGSMPTLNFSGGKLSTDPPGPRRIQHPRLPDVALMIDAGRTEPVVFKQLEDEKLVAYVTGSALYMRQRGDVQVIDFSRSAGEKPMKVEAATYREMERAFNWIFYPSILVIAFLLFAASIAGFGALYALGGMLMAAVMGGSLGFVALFKISVHAQTAAALLRAFEMASPFAVPYSGLLALVLSLGYLWIGVRASLPPAASPGLPAA